MRFGLLDRQQARTISVAQVTSPELYRLQVPVENGPLDPRMGVGTKAGVCATCKQSIDGCPGHFGSLDLELPVYHPMFFKQTLNALKTICKGCSAVLLPNEEKPAYIRKMKRMEHDYLKRSAFFKKIIEECRKSGVCEGCQRVNPKVLKIPKVPLRIELVYEQGKGKKADRLELTALQAWHLLAAVPGHERGLLNLSCQPEQLILRVLPVSPVCIRPSLMLQNNESNEDDLTMKIREIQHLNQRLHQALAEGLDYSKLDKDWFLLNVLVGQYMNSEMAGLQVKELGKKSIRSLCSRLKGKQGRFRQNLSGKRANFTGRTVISPDPNVRLNEVIVPAHMSKILTVTEYVSPRNEAALRAAIQRGPHALGGANFVTKRDGSKLFTSFVRSLEEGDLVERHLRDNDLVIFNRQPSLHRISMMGFRVRVKAGNTLRFNECVCAPFNADFDGDEMNIHVPQTVEAQAQTLCLMGLAQNLMSPKNGEPIVALIQDFITCAFLITDKARFLTKDQFFYCLAAFSDARTHFSVPFPAVLKPQPLWTGKQVISALLRPSHRSRVAVNFTLKEKRYESDECMCSKDGFVVFKDSELLAGQLGKATLGGNKKGLLYALIKDNGLPAAVRVMSRFAKLEGRWFSQYGFTIGLGDVTPSAELKQQNEQRIARSMGECYDLRDEFKKGNLKAQTGKSPEQVLQNMMNQTLSKVRETIGQNCSKFLPKENKPLIMSVCGAKGSPINLSQMIGCVGQQTVGGKRIGNGFSGRSLPHFQQKMVEPVARGFVKNSFNSGLTAIQFFFHTMGGREGLIDTAVKTAETGYMQRRLIKLLEDVSVMYDQTVRSCDRQQIIQLRYGEDGLNPMFADTPEQPVNLPSLEAFVRTLCPRRPGQQQLQSSELTEQYAVLRERHQASYYCDSTKLKFDRCLDDFIAARAEKISKGTSKVTQELCGLTGKQLRVLVKTFWERAARARVQPGETVGAITAQSIGEPATQMTLKTFHFAGISSMNITQGVPRMNEIINAAPSISTPIIDIRLLEEHSLEHAMQVQRRLEVTRLSEVCEEIREVYSQAECFLELRFNMGLLAGAGLTLEEVATALTTQKLGLKRERLQVEGSRVKIACRGEARNEVFELRHLRRYLPEAMLKGIRSLKRVLVNRGQGRYNLFAEGRGLAQLVRQAHVDPTRTTSNHVAEVEEVLGIEAARRSIINEISATMSEHGVSIDVRHTFLLSEIMCWRGRVTGFNRYGVDKFKDSTLMLASFEKTTDFLFEAGAMGKTDRLKGSSERIIAGRPLLQGTGCFDLLMD